MIVFAWLRRRLSRDVDALTPVVALHRAVQGKANLLHTWNFGEVHVQLAEEGFELLGSITGHLRIDVEDVAIRGDKSEVQVLHVAQASRQQAVSAEQDQRKSSLYHD